MTYTGSFPILHLLGLQEGTNNNSFLVVCACSYLVLGLAVCTETLLELKGEETSSQFFTALPSPHYRELATLLLDK